MAADAITLISVACAVFMPITIAAATNFASAGPIDGIAMAVLRWDERWQFFAERLRDVTARTNTLSRDATTPSMFPWRPGDHEIGHCGPGARLIDFLHRWEPSLSRQSLPTRRTPSGASH